MKLNKEFIESNIGDYCPKMPIYVYNSIDSTNTRAKDLANKGYDGDAVFIADEQTAGRGRMGRHFISDGGKGLYLSILLGKEKSKETGNAVTVYMAVIASRVLEKLTRLSPSIKWVNDIFVGGKKLSGILTEGRTDPESGALAYTVCGIGINLLHQEFDSEVKDIATTVENAAGVIPDVNVLASEIIKDFFLNLHLIGSEEIAKEYKNRSFIIGKSVNVIKPDGIYRAEVLDITADCALLLKRDDRTKEKLFTGEVSIRVGEDAEI